MDLKEMQDSLLKSLSDFRGYVDKELGEIKSKGVAHPETTQTIERLSGRIDEIQAKISRPPAPPEGVGAAADRKELVDYMRRGILSEAARERQKAMSVGSDADGGFFVSPDTSGRIVAKVYESTPMRQLATVETTSKDKKTGLLDLGQAGADWEGETQSPSETDTPETSKWEIAVFELRARPKISQQELDDADFDVGAWLERKVAERFSRKENTAFAAGTGAGQPKGITSYTTVSTADATRAWGQLQYIATGSAGDWTSANFEKIYDVEAALKASYRQGAAFLGARAVFTKIRKFKTGDGNFLWQPSVQIGAPPTLIGYPIYDGEDMPAIASNSLSLAFGNFAEGYLIVDRLGIRVLRDPFSSKPYVEFYTTRRTGGGVVNSEAIKLVKFAAS
jgi:HK97 family phage major capsid protein